MNIERYIPPEALAGFVRGLWGALVAGGAAFFSTWGATGEIQAAWIVAGATAFAALAGRTGEGVRDARNGHGDHGETIDFSDIAGPSGLSAEEAEVIRKLRDGSLDYDRATPRRPV